jgi:CubicO group peptidase (beta-lactamase class C family)
LRIEFAAGVLRNGSLEESGITEKQLQKIESKIDEWYADSEQPMAIVIARAGVIVTAKGYGEVGHKPVTVDTPMLLHSAMKPLIGLQLSTLP